MDPLNYTIYEIDVVDILAYESGWYAIKDRDKTSTNELYKFLRQGVLKKIVPDMVMESLEISDYERGLKAKLKNITDLDECWGYFVKCFIPPLGNHSFIVRLALDNQLIFQKFFILKLRQYTRPLVYLDAFLNYQFKVNFKYKPAKFRQFFDNCMDQYDDIDSKIIKGVNHWFNEMEKKREEKALKPKAKRSRSMNVAEMIKGETGTAISKMDSSRANQIDITNSIPNRDQVHNELSSKNEPREDLKLENKLTEMIDETQVDKKSLPENSEQNSTELNTGESRTKKTIPKDYIEIRGKFDDEEIIVFFSFLHKEKSEEDKPFLEENQVIEMFKYGLSIPPVPASPKYNLNSSLKFPKAIVEYGIYTFFSRHTPNKQKKDILKFFASYIQDFEKALLSAKNLQVWSNNVKKKKPRRMKFAFGNYLPERFK